MGVVTARKLALSPNPQPWLKCEMCSVEAICRALWISGSPAGIGLSVVGASVVVRWEYHLPTLHTLGAAYFEELEPLSLLSQAAYLSSCVTCFSPGKTGLGTRAGPKPIMVIFGGGNAVCCLVQDLTWKKAGKEAHGWASARGESWEHSPTICNHSRTRRPVAEVWWVDGDSGLDRVEPRPIREGLRWDRA